MQITRRVIFQTMVSAALAKVFTTSPAVAEVLVKPDKYKETVRLIRVVQATDISRDHVPLTTAKMDDLINFMLAEFDPSNATTDKLRPFWRRELYPNIPNITVHVDEKRRFNREVVSLDTKYLDKMCESVIPIIVVRELIMARTRISTRLSLSFDNFTKTYANAIVGII